MKGVIEERTSGQNIKRASFHSSVQDWGVRVVNEQERLHSSRYRGKVSRLAGSTAVPREGCRRKWDQLHDSELKTEYRKASPLMRAITSVALVAVLGQCINPVLRVRIIEVDYREGKNQLWDHRGRPGAVLLIDDRLVKWATWWWKAASMQNPDMHGLQALYDMYYEVGKHIWVLITCPS